MTMGMRESIHVGVNVDEVSLGCEGGCLAEDDRQPLAFPMADSTGWAVALALPPHNGVKEGGESGSTRQSDDSEE